MIDHHKNFAFWDNAARQSGAEMQVLAGMLMEDRPYEARCRCAAEEQRFLTLWNPHKNARVLEIGSGGGRWALFLANKVQSYLGLDISPSMVEIAERACSAQGLHNAHFYCGDFLDLNPEGNFDLIYFSGVLQYMDDEVVQKSIGKAAQLLTKDGLLISRDSIQTEERIEKNGEYPVVYRLVDDYEKLFRAEGFELECAPMSYDPRRFSRPASRLFQLTGSFRLASLVQTAMCFVDDFFDNPPVFKTNKLRTELKERNRREHRFFKYTRKSNGKV